ncbi:MAG TPA: hypothetical protein VKX96_02050, partial [Chloroflexota bacterium]|nr:hypothetical protein [Chloroflexota bacterium]
SYYAIPTLQHYLLIPQDERMLELHTRNTDGTWTESFASEQGQHVTLGALGCTLSVEEVYRDLVLSEPSEPEPETPRP